MAGEFKVLVEDPLTGAMVLGVPRPPVIITGIDKLVQIVALMMLNNGDRSIFRPQDAGGLRSLIGSNIDPDDPSELFADVRVIVSRVEQAIKEGQVNTSRPPSERLLALHLIDIVPDEDTLSVNVKIAVVNEEQNTAPAVVMVS